MRLSILDILKTKLPDSIIAATTKYHGLELVTLDKKLANKLKLDN
jgi:predicted nucleic acid-binding protein